MGNSCPSELKLWIRLCEREIEVDKTKFLVGFRPEYSVGVGSLRLALALRICCNLVNGDASGVAANFELGERSEAQLTMSHIL